MDVGSAESSFAHVELIRDAFDAVKSGDWEAATRFLARDATWESGFGNYRGRAEIERFWREWVGSFDEFDFALEETADLGGGVLFVAIQLTGRPLGAGGSVQTRQGWIYTWDGEATTNVVTLGDVDEARVVAHQLAQSRQNPDR